MSNEDERWYKDAVIYEVHIKAFADEDGNGVGDFRGLTSKLDYLADLGVTALWLLPFYPSPLRDDGYDIADYLDIHPDYGTLRHFKVFLREAHRRGLKVITELVVNHTSDAHPWFQRARKAKPGSVYRDFYVWSDNPRRYKDARIIFKDFETSNWTWDPVAQSYYWHRFYHHQPDLNYDNPRVVKEIIKVLDYWLDMGVDGLRLDAVPYLFEREGTNCENLSETHAMLRTLRKHIDKKYTGRMLLAEANQWPEDAAQYFGAGDSCHMCFHFPLMPRMFMALNQEDRYPIIDILEQTPEIPENCQWAVFLRNHDELTLEMVTDEERDYMYRMYARDPRARINLGIRRRLAPLLDNDRRKIELMNVLLMSMPGSPVIYYGDELGMGDNYYLGDRDGVRTPMQWSADRNAGFSRANPQRLYLPVIIDPEYHYEAVNVENQQRNGSSLLWWMKNFLAMRRRYKAFGHGTLEFLYPDNPKILAFLRRHDQETLLIVVNLSRFAQAVQFDAAHLSGSVPVDVFSSNPFPTIRKGAYALSLGPHGYYIFELVPEEESDDAHPHVPAICSDIGEGLFLDQTAKDELTSRLLPAYLRRRGWLPASGGPVKSLSILEALPVGDTERPSWLLLLQATTVAGSTMSMNLLLTFVAGGLGMKIQEERPHNILCVNPDQDKPLALVEGVQDRSFCSGLLSLCSRRQSIRGRFGEIRVLPGRLGRVLRETAVLSDGPSMVTPEPQNTLAIYNKQILLKLFRFTDEGVNPDVELPRWLTEKSHFEHTPRYLGTVEYVPRGGSPVSVAVLKEYVHAESTGFELALSAKRLYLERLMAEPMDWALAPGPPYSLTQLMREEIPDRLHGYLSEHHIALMELLGRRAAELHMALSKDYGHPDFTPEPFDKLYRRSVYQEAQSRIKRTLQRLERDLPGLPEVLAAEAEPVIKGSKALLEKLKAFRDTSIRSLKIRVHGDLQLHHVLFTGKDFLLVDFEGKADKSLSARRLKRSPFRDVADMTRSIHYAAYTALLDTAQLRPEDRDALAPFSELWNFLTSATFLRGYVNAAGDAPFMPESDEHLEIILTTFRMEKACAVLDQCLRTSRGQPIIPLRALKALL
ncbi:MAG: maltose alpha-D-glucosyltransferase / alpha-amylase [Desulfovibrionales bacterium]|jgi:maltose alpha-D-glucosyltransferase/alpha-amylase|nr:maltose alpha-D-glucosyltransferase / alpha-amylase [Desulfovibrionales bacterium]